MDGTIFFVTIIGIAISLIVAYYIIKYAVMEALDELHYKNNNTKFENRISDLFIQLGGDPIIFQDAEIEFETRFIEECSILKKSKLSKTKLRIEIERLKNEIKLDLIRKKMEIAAASRK